MRRALGIFDRLLKRVDKAGGKVLLGREHPWKTRVRLEGVELTVRMYELTTRADHVPTKSEEEEIRKGRTWSVRKWDFTPTGELVFVIEDYVGEGVQRKWTDGKRRNLSRRPEKLWEGVLKAVVGMKAVRAVNEERHRKYIEEERKADEARRRQEAEKQRFDELVRRATSWDRARQIRALVTLLRERTLEERGPFEAGSDLDEWFQWAEDCADRLDPVVTTMKELVALASTKTTTPPTSSPRQSPP